MACLPDYVRQHARELYGDGFRTVVSETIGSAIVCASKAMPSRVQTPFPQLAPTPMRPAIDKP
eukprot:11227070-Lingulodinium_polyedra.AAC.1